ncbi:MAG: hypothetical protein IID46_08980 [Planctomycetes bacterium]|nr:hypothetical protein [Planctomycetota bacterium]
MWYLTLLAARTNVIWFLFPLAAVISLVYNASRYELPERILRRSLRLFITIVVFMSIVLAVLMFLSNKL